VGQESHCRIVGSEEKRSGVVVGVGAYLLWSYLDCVQ
jgi:hypothetical protein